MKIWKLFCFLAGAALLVGVAFKTEAKSESLPHFCYWPIVRDKLTDPTIKPASYLGLSGEKRGQKSYTELWVEALLFQSILSKSSPEKSSEKTRDWYIRRLKHKTIESIEKRPMRFLFRGKARVRKIDDSDDIFGFGRWISTDAWFRFFKEEEIHREGVLVEEAAVFVCNNSSLLKTNFLGINKISGGKRKLIDSLENLQKRNMALFRRKLEESCRVPGAAEAIGEFGRLADVVERTDIMENLLDRKFSPKEELSNHLILGNIMRQAPAFSKHLLTEAEKELEQFLKYKKNEIVKILHELYSKKNLIENNFTQMIQELRKNSEEESLLKVLDAISDDRIGEINPVRQQEGIGGSEIYQELKSLYMRRKVLAAFILNHNSGLVRWIYIENIRRKAEPESHSSGRSFVGFNAAVYDAVRASVRFKKPVLADDKKSLLSKKKERIEKIFSNLSVMVAGDGQQAVKRLNDIRRAYTAGNFLLLFYCEPRGASKQIDKALAALFHHLNSGNKFEATDVKSSLFRSAQGKTWVTKYSELKNRLLKAVRTFAKNQMVNRMKEVREDYGMSRKEYARMKAYTKKLINEYSNEFLSEPLEESG